MPSIRIKNGQNKGKVFKITDENITLGRDETQTIQILDQGVSRQHAEIFRIGEMCFARDLESTNGTFINNNKITEELLRSGDEVLIGTTKMAFEDVSASSMFKEPDQVAMDEDEKDEEFGPTVEIKITDTIGISDPKSPNATEVESRNLSASYELGKIISQEHDAQAMLQKALEYLAEITDTSQAYLLLLDKRTGRLISKANVERGSSKKEIKVSRTIVQRVLKSAKPLLSSDAAMDNRFSLSESVVLKRIKSVIAVPLIVKDQVEGLLYFHEKRSGIPFSQADLELLASASLHLGIAISALSSNSSNQRSLVKVTSALVQALDVVNPRKQGHSDRVANYSVAVAAQLDLQPSEIALIKQGALLHDIGKLGTQASLEEKDEVPHVYLGEKIIAEIDGLQGALPAVKYHHERHDGTGFPFNIKGDDIPLMAKIVSVTNAFDNIASVGRIQGESIPIKDVLLDMERDAGTAYDKRIVDALIICHRNGTLYSQINT